MFEIIFLQSLKCWKCVYLTQSLKCFNWAKLSQNALNFVNGLNFPKKGLKSFKLFKLSQNGLNLTKKVLKILNGLNFLIKPELG